MKISELSLSYLKFFIDTVESASFTKAAEKNHVSRPAISQGIARLEAWYGVSLFIHKKREVKLTTEGEAFFRMAQKAYQIFEEQMSLGLESSAKFRIGCSASLADSILGPLFKTVGVPAKLEIKTGRSQQLFRYLEDGAINIAFYIDEAFPREYLTRKIHQGQFGLYSASGQWESVSFTTEERPEVTAFRGWLRKNRRPSLQGIAESWSLARSLASQCQANCLIPDILKAPGFKKIPTPGYRVPYTVFMSHRPLQFLSPLEAEFCGKIKNLKSAL